MVPMSHWGPKRELKRIIPLLSILSSPVDRFQGLRYLNDSINLLYMIGSFASGANVFLVAKNGTKKIIPLLLIKSSLVDRFQSLKCLNDRNNLPYMMGSLASDPTNSLVAKIGTKDLATSC